MHKRRKREGNKNLFDKIMAENFPNPKKTDTQVEEAQKSSPSKIIPKLLPRHITIKMVKIKEFFKAAREKQRVMYNGIPFCISKIEG